MSHETFKFLPAGRTSPTLVFISSLIAEFEKANCLSCPDSNKLESNANSWLKQFLERRKGYVYTNVDRVALIF